MTANQQTAANHPEFRSVILTVDHLSGPRKDGHQAVKAVFSTEDLTETMLSLFDYYDETPLTASKATIELFQKSAQATLPAFVYRTPVNTQIVLDWNCFAFLSQVAGSTLGATTLALNNAGLAQLQSDEMRGDVVPLLLMDFGMEAVKDPASDQAPPAAPKGKRPQGTRTPARTSKR